MPQLLTEASEPVNILYYGEGGTGKTTAVAHMAKLGKVLVFNAESGVKARALKQYGIPLENIEVFPGPGEEITFESLESEWLRIREELHKNPDAYVGVIWDSITEIYQVLLGNIVARAYEKAVRQDKDRDPDFIALEDYGVMTNQMRSLVRKYRDLPCHFAVTALAKRDQDDDGTVAYNPQVTAKLQNDLVGWMDVVCVTQLQAHPDGGDDEYRGLFRPSGKWRGKDRFKMLPKGIVDPTFDRVRQYVDGEITTDDDEVMKAAKARMAASSKQDKKEPVPA